MKMDEMNAYFESKGFKATRSYNCTENSYDFLIEKNGNHLHGIYKWPLNQMDFMKTMIKAFEKEFNTFSITYSDIIPAKFLADEKRRAETNNCNFSVECEQNSDCLTVHFVLHDKYCDKTYINDLYISHYCDKLQDVRRNVIHIIEELYEEMNKNRIKISCNAIYGTSGPAWDGFRAGFLNAIPPIVKNIDVIPEKEMWTKMNPHVRSISGHHPWGTHIKNVIFNDPATIVFWTDGSKTVVKAQDDDVFDPEKGLAMAITKKALGNKGNYCNELKKWLPEEEETTLDMWKIKIPEFYKQVSDIQKKVYEAFGLKKDTKLESVQKAYEILTQLANGKGKLTKTCYEDAIEEAMGFLGQALED